MPEKTCSTNLLLPSMAIPSRIIMPENGANRARKVVHRSNHGHVVKFASKKCSRTLELESLLEYDRAIQLEFHPDVITFQEQPFLLEYADDGVIKKIFPDFLVLYRDGSRIIEEVKPLKEAALPEFCRRSDIEKRVLSQHGYGFDVLTELKIRHGLELVNSKKLLPYRRYTVSSLLRESVKNVLCKGAETGHALIGHVAGLTEEALYTMVAHGHIVGDLSVSLGLATLYSLIDKDS